jgi:hypothetical protein
MNNQDPQYQFSSPQSMLGVAVLVLGALITVDNNKPKFDTSGNIVNAHDGTYRFIDGMWYYHGAEYGLCAEPPKLGCDGGGTHGCGFHGDHNVSIWRSPDLSSGSWERVGTAAHCATDVPDCAILYRPHLVQAPEQATDAAARFLLYVNYVRKGGGYGGNAVFGAAHPAGPFTLLNPTMNLARLCPGPAASAPCGGAQGGAGDFDVFVDPADGAGYIVYSARHWISIERLTPDLQGSTGENATWADKTQFGGTVAPDYFIEAPVMFARGGSYFVLYGHCCCFCEQGSGIIVATAPHPMGPWTRLPGDLACVPPPVAAPPLLQSLAPRGVPTPGQGCLYGGSTDVSTTRSQQNFVIRVPAAAAGGDDTLIWTGDRWQQAPDGIKGHEGQFWAPLAFDDKGRLQKVSWIDEFNLTVPDTYNRSL